MKHAVVATGLATYEEAFEVAAKVIGKKRKTSWHGRARIRFRTVTGTFEVQVPA
jgi:hypothetical protein